MYKLNTLKTMDTQREIHSTKDCTLGRKKLQNSISCLPIKYKSKNWEDQCNNGETIEIHILFLR